MWWQNIILIVAVPILGIYCFLVIAGFEKRMLASKTSRTAENMHGTHANSAPKLRRRARQQGGR